MATDRQIAANRANAQKSTGPRTPEGKAASSFNALKTGIYANSTLIPGEDAAEYEALRQEHYDQFHPANPDERDLLDLMIKYKWQLLRLHNCYEQMWLREVEDAVHSEYHNPEAPLVRPFKAANLYNNSLTTLSHIIHSTDRALHRTRTALIRTQEKRQHAESKAAEPELASFPQEAPQPLVLAGPAPSPQCPAPIPIGFVPPKPELLTSHPQFVRIEVRE